VLGESGVIARRLLWRGPFPHRMRKGAHRIRRAALFSTSWSSKSDGAEAHDQQVIRSFAGGTQCALTVLDPLGGGTPRHAGVPVPHDR
jgi:hypothetical protein